MRIEVKEGGVIRRNKKTYRPGESLDVSEAEAKRLIAIGAVRTSVAEEEMAPEEEIAETAAGLESMTVTQLKESLAERGVDVPKDARKAELVELLEAAREKE
jgi:hypothetical protein